MAVFRIARVDMFPEGTTIKVFPANAYHKGQTGAPAGTETTSGTVSSGVYEASGLVAGAPYVAYASVSSTDRYLEIRPEAGTTKHIPDIGDVTSKTSAEIDALLPVEGENAAIATGLVSSARVLLVRKVSSGKWWKVALTEIA